MPDDRLLHSRLGYSAKVSGLDHLTYRVWTQYLLSADDYGVMPCNAAVIRGANLALAKVPEDEIHACLETIITCELVLAFEHQGQRYVCSPEWQDYQKVRFQRTSYHPTPPPKVLSKCSPKTREVFEKRDRETTVVVPKYSRNAVVATPDRIRNVPTDSSSLESSQPQANGLRLTASGSGSGEEPEKGKFRPTDVDDVGTFAEQWPGLVAAVTGRPHHLIVEPRYWPDIQLLIGTYGLTRSVELAEALLRTPHWDGKPRTIAMLRANAPEIDRWLVEHPGVPFRAPLQNQSSRQAANKTALANWAAKETTS